jgi:hypothetical protein
MMNIMLSKRMIERKSIFELQSGDIVYDWGESIALYLLLSTGCAEVHENSRLLVFDCVYINDSSFCKYRTEIYDEPEFNVRKAMSPCKDK